MRSTRVVLLLTAVAVEGFVLSGAPNEAPSSLPGRAFRWTVPADAGASAGLGGGLSWVLDSAFCDDMLGRFPERDLFYGLELPWVQFVHCSDVRDAVHRGFATWSANHRLVSFSDVGSTAPCAAPGSITGALSDTCPWELYVGTADGTAHPTLAAYVTNHRSSAVRPESWFREPMRSPSGEVAYGIDAHARSVMRFQTHLCWYLDATFCYYFQRLHEEHSLDVLLIVRAVLLAVFGLAAMRLAAILFWCLIALLCLSGKSSSRLRRRGCCSSACSACLDYLSSLSPCANVLVIFCIVFPPVFVRRARALASRRRARTHRAPATCQRPPPKAGDPAVP